MSIYATLWVLRFPSFGQFYIGCDWLTVIAQGVPAHVGAEATDQFALFLPPMPGNVAAGLRAVVFVAEGTVKGTAQSAQEYRAPLMFFRVRSTHRFRLRHLTRESAMLCAAASQD